MLWIPFGRVGGEQERMREQFATGHGSGHGGSQPLPYSTAVTVLTTQDQDDCGHSPLRRNSFSFLGFRVHSGIRALATTLTLLSS